MVFPTKSGEIVLLRAQVLMMVRSSLARAITFFSSFGSINGPFLSDLLIDYFLLLACRPRTINLLVDLRLRVLKPSVGCPQGVRGLRPIPWAPPSPPPCG